MHLTLVNSRSIFFYNNTGYALKGHKTVLFIKSSRYSLIISSIRCILICILPFLSAEMVVTGRESQLKVNKKPVALIFSQLCIEHNLRKKSV